MRTKFVKFIIVLLKLGAFFCYLIYSLMCLLTAYNMADRNITIEEHCTYIGSCVGLIMMYLLFFQKIDNEKK